MIGLHPGQHSRVWAWFSRVNNCELLLCELQALTSLYSLWLGTEGSCNKCSPLGYTITFYFILPPQVCSLDIPRCLLMERCCPGVSSVTFGFAGTGKWFISLVCPSKSKDVHVLHVNVSISVEESNTEIIVMMCWISLGAESQNLCDSSSLASSVALPWVNHYSVISSLMHQTIWYGSQWKAIISIHLWIYFLKACPFWGRIRKWSPCLHKSIGLALVPNLHPKSVVESTASWYMGCGFSAHFSCNRHMYISLGRVFPCPSTVHSLISQPHFVSL